MIIEIGSGNCLWLEILAYSVEKEECIPDLDDYWSNWMQWSKCTASCGKGTRSRKRICVGQTGHGRPCVGSATNNEFCSLEECQAGMTLLSGETC